MINYCDYDMITHYSSGEFNCKFKTDLQGRIKEIDKIKYPTYISESFKNQEYKSYITLEPLILYRVFGMFVRDDNKDFNNGARINGAFASTEFAESLIDAKIRLALNPKWMNTKMYEVKIIIPKDSIISVGVVAPVKLETGTILDGGADQILLPKYWPEDWIIGYRRITARQLQSEPIFINGKPPKCNEKDELYGLVCPKCGRESIKKLDEKECFTIVGKKGGRYKMKFCCLYDDCNYYW